jgi:Flp pilus assembly protein TadD
MPNARAVCFFQAEREAILPAPISGRRSTRLAFGFTLHQGSMSTTKPRRSSSVRDPLVGQLRAVPGALPRIYWWVVFAMVVATVAAYVPAMRAPFVMDDELTIDASATGAATDQLPTAGRPLVLATIAANYAINRALGVDQSRDPAGPNKAIGYRVFNLLVHLLTGGLLFGVLRRAMRERTIPDDWRAVADPLALAVCALWLLHPIQTEVINYIVQRSEALASLFYLGVMYASQRAWESNGNARIRWYALAVVCCVLGMSSKEIVISAPLAVMLYDRAFRLPSWRALSRPGDGRGWLYVALWIACIAAFAGFEAGARGATAGFGASMTWYGYLYTQCWAIAHYLRLVVWPNPLSVDYGSSLIRGTAGVPGMLLLIALAAGTIGAWTRVSRFGWLAFCGSWFFMLLAPSSSVVPIVSEVAAERRMYLAMAAVLVVAVVAVEWIRRRVASSASPRWLVVAGVGAVSVLAVATGRRSHTYASAEALWRSAVTVMPENPRALSNLGWALLRTEHPRLAEAESVFTKAMAIDSTCHFGCLQYATVLARAGQLAEAEGVMRRAVEADPGNVIPMRALARVQLRQREYSQAIPELEQMAGRYPTLDHLVVLGVAYLSAGRRTEAIATFDRTKELDGGSREMKEYSGRLDDAARHPDALGALQQLATKLSVDW